MDYQQQVPEKGSYKLALLENHIFYAANRISKAITITQ